MNSAEPPAGLPGCCISPGLDRRRRRASLAAASLLDGRRRRASLLNLPGRQRGELGDSIGKPSPRENRTPRIWPPSGRAAANSRGGTVGERRRSMGQRESGWIRERERERKETRGVLDERERHWRQMGLGLGRTFDHAPFVRLGTERASAEDWQPVTLAAYDCRYWAMNSGAGSNLIYIRK